MDMGMGMSEMRRHRHGKTKRLTAAKLAPPDWFGWTAVAAMFLLVVARLPLGGSAWTFPLLSFGEWLLLPLGAAALTMGLLALWKVRERTWMPLWLSAVAPGILWLLAIGLCMLKNDVTQIGGDMFLAWAVRLVFPTMAFLPLLAQPLWRDRLMWALAAGVAANAVAIFWQGRTSGLALPDPGLLELGGFLGGQYDYGLLLAVALPLLASWRGGETSRRRALATMLCTFLLPALALGASFSWVALAATAIGLAVSLVTWRGGAWIMGIFLCLLLFGYGAESRREREVQHRRLLAASFDTGRERYAQAFKVFETKPFFGVGPEAFLAADAKKAPAPETPTPWYAALLGGSGLAGLGIWLVILAQLAARSMGQFGWRCLLHGGVLGGAFGLAAAGLWTDAMPQGAGALVGLLLAVSIVEEEVVAPLHARTRRQRRNKKSAPLEGAREVGFFTVSYPEEKRPAGEAEPAEADEGERE